MNKKKIKIAKKVWHAVIYVITILVFFVLVPVAKLLYKKKNYWLISEIDFDARDNGFCFFKYLNRHHPEINSVYLISKSNRMFSKVEKIGKTVEPYSLKHMLLYIGSSNIISTIVNGCSPSRYLSTYEKKHRLTSGKLINLKHGIYKDFSKIDLKENAHQNMICCGAQPEYLYILSTYGYSEKEVKYTGLARFDDLHKFSTKKYILIMPTWRKWLDSLSLIEFRKSYYLFQWKSFLLSRYVTNDLANNYKIFFYIHPKMNRFSECFSDLPSSITVLSSEQNDLQRLIGESEFLITDFSSVFFDFAYLDKMVFYFQFDEKEFYKFHYKKTYFDYFKDGFGPVTLDKESLINSINDYLKDKKDMLKKYEKNRKKFFVLKDKNNCERIFNAIKELKK